MGNGEVTTPTETQKSTSTQEQPPSSPAMVYPDWASFQAYYNAAGTSPMPPPGFLHSPVALSPQGHPYLWGPQPMLPSYGTPPPYVAMYPHGGLYPHPSIPLGSYPYGPFATPSANGTAEASRLSSHEVVNANVSQPQQVAVASGAETDGKLHEGKQRSPLKKSRESLGSLNMLTGKVNDTRNASVNGAFSQSGESGSEVSSEGSDHADSQNGSQQRHGSEHGSGNEGANKASSARTTSNEVTQTLPTPVVLNPTVPFVAIPPGGLAGPATTLNIGMDYRGGPAPISAVRGKLPAAPSIALLVPCSLEGSRDRVPSDPSIQSKDERELKRQKRKQSNRESARRSRLRKQAEFEELANHAETLKEENNSLKEELERMRGKCGKLSSENATLTEKLKKHLGEESREDEQVDPVNGDG